MGQIIIRGLELPMKVKGVTVVDDNGDFNVYINNMLSQSEIESTTVHELKHIRLDHFYDTAPVVINELEAG